VRKRKTSGCEADICFSCAINEQSACEAGFERGTRVIASLRGKTRIAQKKNKRLRV
jgi:hypothetical protein